MGGTFMPSGNPREHLTHPCTANRHIRVRSQLPTCYHEGFLEKKSIRDKMGRKLWTSLCGNSLFFFNNTKDSVYVEKLELTDLITLSDDCCRDRNLNAAGFTLHMKNEDIKMIAPSLEARELWKGFLLSISKLSVPTSLNLLPGQIHMMKEIIEKEKKRQRLLSVPPPSQDSDNYVIVVPEMPMCYYPVNRVEAEILLERNADQGNLLLRRRQDGSFALTTRQDINGSVFKHYCVSRRPEGGFAIALETPVSCNTLHDVVNYLVEKSSGVLVPLLMEHHYEKNITIIKPNEENGEIIEHCLRNVPSPTPPTPPPKPVTRCVGSSSELNTPENEYLSASDTGEFEVDQATCRKPPVLPRLPGRYLPHQNSVDLHTSSDGERKPLVPPGYCKTPSRSNSLSSLQESCSTRSKPSLVDMNELQNAIRRRAMLE
ncbi:signal-transducing adaptor protein 2b isoform X2 [Megalobrama amblycephala]|uniref:signal-transducing adaptor protein 2b isoform X2 n=1 Tax=Megalobrama amblycephala TaxID=75352 RepID=UPI0020143CA1|nr:signal-transducing adaptor protein 2b isoform X2 [Megalobrama amblycephala]